MSGKHSDNCFEGDVQYNAVEGLHFEMVKSSIYDYHYFVNNSVSADCFSACDERKSAYMGIVSTYSQHIVVVQAFNVQFAILIKNNEQF